MFLRSLEALAAIGWSATRQVGQTVQWTIASLDGHAGAILWTVDVDTHHHCRGMKYDIATDACPQASMRATGTTV